MYSLPHPPIFVLDFCRVKFIPFRINYKLPPWPLHLDSKEARTQLVLGSGAVVPLDMGSGAGIMFSVDRNDAFLKGMRDETLVLPMVVRNPKEILKTEIILVFS